MFKNLFKQTFIYGLATVLPRMLSFLLVPLYTRVMPNPETYGEVTLIYAGFAIFNVFIAYGMETAFFRFYSKESNPDTVISTSLISLAGSSAIFALIALLLRDELAGFLNIDTAFVGYIILILVLDALAIIPFAWLRAREKPMRYATIKILNVSLNLGLNIFFLVILPGLASGEGGFWNRIYTPNFEINYILIANVIASGVALLLVGPLYLRQPFVFDTALWGRMLRYAIPVMIAGIAFTINEVFDRILLSELLPQDIAKAELGKYQACYKLALFMTLFAAAFRLGIEPFFFRHANTENPEKAYGQITNYFIILGSLILITVVVFADVVKLIIDSAYWEAMNIVPIILLAGFFLGIYHNLSVWYKVTDRTHVGAIISSVGAGLTLLINIALIPSIGYLASALATLTAYASMMVISYLWGKKVYPVPYNLRKIGFYMGLSILFSALAFYIFKGNLWIGTSLWIIFLAVLIKMEGPILKRIFIPRES